MKATGIVRKLDCLGRIVLPKELRRTLEISDNDGLEIFTEEDKIILRKYEPNCIFCGESEGIKVMKGKIVCKKCMDEITQLAE